MFRRARIKLISLIVNVSLKTRNITKKNFLTAHTDDTHHVPFEHSNKMRERIALVLFIVVLALAAFLVSLYFGTAKTFNIAATKVDEKAGTMEFCSSIIYSGVLIQTPEKGESLPNLTKRKKVYTSDVRSSYIDKQASVVTIDLNEIAAIEKPLILDVGEKQVGIFAISSYTPKKQIEQTVEELKEGGANVILCVAPRSNMLGSYDGVNAILCTKEASPSETTEDHIEGTFIFRSAEVGQVGALSVSSSNAFIQKVYSGEQQ